MADATEQKPDGTPKKAKQGRSPGYPSINIQEAIAKAKALYAAEGKYPAPMPSAFTAWGFSMKSSGGRGVRASLKYFGLITVDGDNETGKVKLTDDALRIILDEREDQTEKNAIIRKLALLPSIHQALMAAYPNGLASDASVEHLLIFEQGYNKSAAAEVISEFKATAAYAGFYKPAIVADKSDPDTGNEDPQEEDEPDGKGKTPPADRIPPKGSQVKLMDGERVVFTEEGTPNQYLKLVASGDVDDVLLEALEDFVKRQRKRLGRGQPGQFTGASATGSAGSLAPEDD